MLHRPSRPRKHRHPGLYGAKCFTGFPLQWLVATSGESLQKCSEAWMPRSKRFQGWTKRRFLPFGSDFCGHSPGVTFGRQ
jgi:hypothetical protein